jgi:tetratricopeptide (TPR) repeat protein
MRRFLAFSLLVGGLLTNAMAEDQVYRKGQAPERGILTEMSNKEVTLSAGGTKRSFAANEIQRITFDDEPNSLSQARRDILEAGNYKSALDDLKKIDAAKIEREVVRQEVEYYRALCMAKLAMSEGGDKAAAEAALKEFATKNKDNWHFYAAAELLGDVAASAGKYADAARYYGPVATTPWEETKARANVALARMLAAQGKYPEALEKYEAVEKDSSTADTETYKQQAIVGRAMCLAETGKPDEAIKLLTDAKGVIATNDPKDARLMSRAYNALGSAYLKADKKKDAILAFLHTDLLYFQEADAHAEALYHLATLFNQVNKADRAIEASNTLKQRYAGSVWASKK